MEDNINLVTLDYKNYKIARVMSYMPIVICKNLKNTNLTIKKRSISICYEDLKNLGKQLYELNDEEIKLSSTINKMIEDDIDNDTDDYLKENYYENYTDELYINISNYDEKLLIEWLNKYGIQTALYNVYEDLTKLNSHSTEKVTSDLLYLTELKKQNDYDITPIINLALSIYFISSINDTLIMLLKTKNKSYSYSKISLLLTPFPYLSTYFETICCHKQSTFDDDKKLFYYKFDNKDNFVNNLTNYMYKLCSIINIYLSISELPNAERISTHNNLEITNKIKNYNNLDFFTTKEVHHNILHPCFLKLIDSVINFFPKCPECSTILKYKNVACTYHLIEFGRQRLKSTKLGKDKKVKIEYEIPQLEKNESFYAEELNKLYRKKLIQDKSNSKKREKLILTDLQDI